MKKGRTSIVLMDFHTHLFPDALAPKALGRLAAVSGIAPVTNGTASDTGRKLRAWGVDRAVVMHVSTNPKQQENVNRFAVELNGSGPFLCFGSVHPDSPDPAGSLARLRDAGIRGVKLHPDYQAFDADERRVYPLYEAAQALDLLCCFHAGFDPLSPDHIHATPEKLLRVHRDFPRLRMILAHFGSFRLWDDVERLLAGETVWLDTSFCAGELPPEKARRLVARHGAQRILFGSDCPWLGSGESLRYLQSLGLSEREMEQICWQNGAELMGL